MLNKADLEEVRDLLLKYGDGADIPKRLRSEDIESLGGAAPALALACQSAVALAELIEISDSIGSRVIRAAALALGREARAALAAAGVAAGPAEPAEEPEGPAARAERRADRHERLGAGRGGWVEGVDR